jgi:hypothetical protein
MASLLSRSRPDCPIFAFTSSQVRGQTCWRKWPPLLNAVGSDTCWQSSPMFSESHGHSNLSLEPHQWILLPVKSVVGELLGQMKPVVSELCGRDPRGTSHSKVGYFLGHLRKLCNQAVFFSFEPGGSLRVTETLRPDQGRSMLLLPSRGHAKQTPGVPVRLPCGSLL